MVPDPSTHTTAARSSPDDQTDDQSSPVLNGLVGGLTGSFLSFIPFATILGGVLAGYLEGGDRPEDGLKPGAIAGVVMFLPVAFMLFLGMFLLGLGSVPALFGVLGIGILLVGGLYAIGLSTLGGYLGVYLKNEL